MKTKIEYQPIVFWAIKIYRRKNAIQPWEDITKYETKGFWERFFFPNREKVYDNRFEAENDARYILIDAKNNSRNKGFIVDAQVERVFN